MTPAPIPRSWRRIFASGHAFEPPALRGDSERAGWTQLDPAGPSWTQLDRAGPSWTELDRAGPGWAQLGPAGPSWTRMDPAGPSWTQLDPAGPARRPSRPAGGRAPPRPTPAPPEAAPAQDEEPAAPHPAADRGGDHPRRRPAVAPAKNSLEIASDPCNSHVSALQICHGALDLRKSPPIWIPPRRKSPNTAGEPPHIPLSLFSSVMIDGAPFGDAERDARRGAMVPRARPHRAERGGSAGP
eukprot:gene18030-biopygen13716